MHKKRYKYWAILICVWGIAFSIAAYVNTQRYNRKFYGGWYINTDWAFKDINTLLIKYVEKHGTIPENAEEFSIFCKSQNNGVLPGESLISLWKTEDIYEFEPNTTISDILDGTGGWFYDKKRMIIVPNVTIAINHFIKFPPYIGPGIGIIPAQWKWPKELPIPDKNQIF